MKKDEIFLDLTKSVDLVDWIAFSRLSEEEREERKKELEGEEMMTEELTEKMHGEFQISSLDEIKHRVFSFLTLYENASEEEKEKGMQLYDITKKEVDTFINEFQELKKKRRK